MIKRFCDVCGKEIHRNLTSDRLRGYVNVRGHRVGVEVMCGVGSSMNGGNLCAECLHDAIHETFDACGYEDEV